MSNSIKNKVFLFTDTTCIELTNPANLSDYKNGKHCVINPDLSLVNGVERQFWKLENHKILPMEQSERNERKKYIKSLEAMYHPIITKVDSDDLPRLVRKYTRRKVTVNSYKLHVGILVSMCMLGYILYKVIQ